MTLSGRADSANTVADAQLDDREAIQSGYRYAVSLSGHHQDAEDLVQQAWIKCHRRYGRIRNLATLFVTIRNLYYDGVRRDKIIQFEPFEETETSNDNTPISRLDLESLMNHLRPEEREALYLNVIQGFTAKEIAKQTGSPRNTVLSLIHRARAKLSGIVGKEKTPNPAARENL